MNAYNLKKKEANKKQQYCQMTAIAFRDCILACSNLTGQYYSDYKRKPEHLRYRNLCQQILRSCANICLQAQQHFQLNAKFGMLNCSQSRC